MYNNLNRVIMSEYQKIDVKWISDGITLEMDSWAKQFGKYLCAIKDKDDDQNKKAALTTGQLRRFFGEVKHIESDIKKYKSDIIMLKLLLAYAVGRDIKKTKGGNVNKTRIDAFAKEITKAIDVVLEGKSDDEIISRFKNFVKVFEAVVAYHKYYGGQESSKN